MPGALPSLPVVACQSWYPPALLSPTGPTACLKDWEVLAWRVWIRRLIRRAMQNNQYGATNDTFRLTVVVVAYYS